MTTSNSIDSAMQDLLTAQSIVNQNYYIRYSTSTNTTNYNDTFQTIYTNYIPFQNNYVYDSFQWRYTMDITGLREYMFANNLYKELSDILYDMYLLTDDEQDFEDSLYRNTLDLIYDFTRPEETFKDLLNENFFAYQGLNKIIYEIIETYRSNFKMEEF